MKIVELYSDGSCISNPGPGGWACILKCTMENGEYEKEFSLSISPIVDKINKEKLQRNLGRYDKDVAKKMRSIFKVENTNSPVVMLLPNPIKIIKKLKHSILSSDKKSP